MKKKRKSSKNSKTNNQSKIESDKITKLVETSEMSSIENYSGSSFSCTICRPPVMFQTNEDRGKHMSEYHPYSLDIEFGTDSTIRLVFSFFDWPKKCTNFKMTF